MRPRLVGQNRHATGGGGIVAGNLPLSGTIGAVEEQISEYVFYGRASRRDAL